MTVVEFLLARIAEEEAVARNVDPGHFEHEALTGDAWDDVAELLRVFNPARVLVECEAKRKLIRDYSEPGRTSHFSLDDLLVMDYVLEILASVYADHPDFREEWPL